jgi:hypothetical protein
MCASPTAKSEIPDEYTLRSIYGQEQYVRANVSQCPAGSLPEADGHSLSLSRIGKRVHAYSPRHQANE